MSDRESDDGIKDGTVENKIIVQAEFYDGYSFKKLIETLSTVISNGNLIFTQDTWYLCELNPNKTTMVFVAIRTNELIDYKFDHHKDELKMGIDFQTLHKHSKTIGKKNSVIFRVEENGSPDNLLIVLSSENASNSAVSPITVADDNVGMPAYPNEKPILVKGGPFSKICASMGQLPNLLEDTVIISAYQNGFRMEALESSKESIRTMDFGDLYTDDNQKLKENPVTEEFSAVLDKKHPAYITKADASSGVIVRFGIEKNKIKMLSRLDSLSHMGIIKFSFSKDSPMKVSCRIGSYGTFVMYVKE
uniref:Proliferating cell nuclear antigen n=1 Tax=Pithovirus LCPAC403 TaxID=2506596 RepID=A0A481ZAU0_9VIRU|nr:MAG: proliferating cell nuclear antigen [Pithovirus LCPAC403]